MIEHIPHIQRCYQLADEAVADGNHPFGALLVLDGEVIATAKNDAVMSRNPTRLLVACHEIFARGRRHIAVVGPVLEDQGQAKHLVYWRREPPIPEGRAV